MDTQKRLSHICFLQFIGPIFVILGHSGNGILTSGAWWIFSKEWIYFFHLPLFFFISGYLFSFKGGLTKKYGTFIKSKSFRLIIPYAFWNIAFYLPKVTVFSTMYNDAKLDIFYLIRVFFYPRENIWGHTWFLVGLFLIYLLAPLWDKLLKEKKLIWIITTCIGLILYVIPQETNFLCISDLHKDILFFWIGCMIGTMPIETLNNISDKYFKQFMAAAVVSSIICLIWYDMKTLWFIPCFFIIITLLFIGTKIHFGERFFEIMSFRMFGIYIMHWPIMLAIQTVLYKSLNVPLAVVIPITIIFGYAIPNLILNIFGKVSLGRFEKPFKYLLGIQKGNA